MLNANSSEVTVAVPVFNGERFIRECLDSLLGQTHPPAKIVCVDDASTDRSVEIIESYASHGVELLRNEVRRGLTANWNRCVSLVDTPLFVIAHQDDVYEPEYLESMAALLRDHPRAFIAHCRARYIDASSNPIDHPAMIFKDRFWPRDECGPREASEELRVLARGDYVICPSVMFRNSLVRELGPFDESLAFVPDWDYWLRGVEQGMLVAGTRRRLLRYRFHEASATRLHEKTLRRFEEEISICDRIANRHPSISRPYAAALNTILSEFCARLDAGDRSGASVLIDLARARVPGFGRSLHGRVMLPALYGGRLAGRALAVARQLYVRFARPL